MPYFSVFGRWLVDADAEQALLAALQPLRDADGAFRLHVTVRLTVAVRPAS